MGVQRVSRLEQHRGPAWPPVREQEALDHLVRAVGAEHLGGVDRVVGGERRSQGGRFTIGVAVQRDGPQLVGQCFDKGVRRRLGGLVGVQPDIDLDLRRVVPGPKGRLTTAPSRDLRDH